MGIPLQRGTKTPETRQSVWQTVPFLVSRRHHHNDCLRNHRRPHYSIFRKWRNRTRNIKHRRILKRVFFFFSYHRHCQLLLTESDSILGSNQTDNRKHAHTSGLTHSHAADTIEQWQHMRYIWRSKRRRINIFYICSKILSVKWAKSMRSSRNTQTDTYMGSFIALWHENLRLPR